MSKNPAYDPVPPTSSLCFVSTAYVLVPASLELPSDEGCAVCRIEPDGRSESGKALRRTEPAGRQGNRRDRILSTPMLDRKSSESPSA
jgi:hypothetical protein